MSRHGWRRSRGGQGSGCAWFIILLGGSAIFGTALWVFA